jgi:hypothetical protein
MRQSLGATHQSSMQTCIRQLKYAIPERVCLYLVLLPNSEDYAGALVMDLYTLLLTVYLHIYCLIN